MENRENGESMNQRVSEMGEWGIGGGEGKTGVREPFDPSTSLRTGTAQDRPFDEQFDGLTTWLRTGPRLTWLLVVGVGP
jgi:hypothetical protein